MVRIDDVEAARLSNAVACPVKFGDKVLKFKLAPLNGDVLGRIKPLYDSYNSAFEKSGGDMDKANQYLDLDVIIDFREILVDWLITDLEGSEEECEDAAYIILNSREGISQIIEYFKSVHGFDKMTEREELIKEIGENRVKKKNDRKPKKDRNRTPRPSAK